MSEGSYPSKPPREDENRPMLIDDSEFQNIETQSGVGYTREFSSQPELRGEEDEGWGASFGQIVAALFDDEFCIERFSTFKSATSAFLLLTLFVQNCTQLRLLVLARNSYGALENSGLWGVLIFFMSIVVILLVIAAVMLFFISMLPVDGQGGTNRKALVRMTIMLSALVSVTCLLNVFCTTLIFAESKETIYLRQNPLSEMLEVNDD